MVEAKGTCPPMSYTIHNLFIALDHRKALPLDRGYALGSYSWLIGASAIRPGRSGTRENQILFDLNR
jgi:hypothetical protein